MVSKIVSEAAPKHVYFASHGRELSHVVERAAVEAGKVVFILGGHFAGFRFCDYGKTDTGDDQASTDASAVKTSVSNFTDK